MHFLTNLDDIQYAAATCWFVEAHDTSCCWLLFFAQVIFEGQNSADVNL